MNVRYGNCLKGRKSVKYSRKKKKAREKRYTHHYRELFLCFAFNLISFSIFVLFLHDHHDVVLIEGLFDEGGDAFLEILVVHLGNDLEAEARDEQASRDGGR